MASNFVPASDRSLLVSFGDTISFAAHRKVVAVTQALLTYPISGVLNVHPAYCSVLIVFDPLRTDHDAIRAVVSPLVEHPDNLPRAEPRTVEIPVCYGGQMGPDLEGLARDRGLTPEQAIALHSSAEYIACFIGFVPGFAYLAGLPEQLAAPRLKTPRQKVPAGSLGIAGMQTGIYPFETPGGWRLIGRTPRAIFRADRDPMSLIALGDRVRFIPVTAEEFSEPRP